MSRNLVWLIQNDLLGESRSWQLWPEALLLGTSVTVLFGLQISLPLDYQPEIVGPVVWFTILFAGLPTLDRSFSGYRQDRCLEGLLLAPIRPATIFLAKVIVNLLALMMLACLILPLRFALSDIPPSGSIAGLALVAFLTNLGLATIGTILSAIAANGSSRRGGLALLLFPLVTPLLLAASESTRLALDNTLNAEWYRWVQFLAIFSAIFLTSGIVLSEFILKD